MALLPYAKWSIVAAVFWSLFFVVLFGGIIQKTAIIREYSCTVSKFSVDPRFECDTKCPLLSEEPVVADDNMELYAQMDFSEFDLESMYEKYTIDADKYPHTPKDDRQPHCDDLLDQTLRWYSPKLCLKARWGFEDPLCPPEKATCYTGHNWHRKCHLSCPLAYNITLGLDIHHLGHVDKSRDLGTDADKYIQYKNEYGVGKKMTCQVMLDGSNDIKWVDERMSHKALQWWKWSLFVGTMLMSLFATVAAITNYILYREAHRDYDSVSDEDNEAGPNPIVGRDGRGVGANRVSGVAGV